MSIAQVSKELNEAISNGIKVRFLLPDWLGENWMATVALLDGVGQNEGRAKRKLASTLLWLEEKNAKGQIPDTFEIRLLDCVFPIRMTIIDPDSEQGYMYIHINSYINKYGNNVTYNLTKQQHWFELYKKEFENMWNDAREIDFNQVRELI